MTPYWSDGTVTLHLGDCLDVLAGIEPASVDAVVTDPPYGLEFMGKEWDSFAQNARSGARADGGPSFGSGMRYQEKGMPAMRAYQDWCQQWAAQCLRVLKPGGHLLAFGGTRTWHRLTCGIEDAGFEIRDSVADLTGREGPGLLWVYGQGFPKSLDVSKAIDKAGPAERRIRYPDFGRYYAEKRRAAGLSHAQICAALGAHGSVNHGGASSNWETGLTLPTVAQWDRLMPLLGISGDRSGWPMSVKREYEREIIGSRPVQPGVAFTSDGPSEVDVTAPATEDAARWEGWGTALKPAWEPIVVARKPLAGTVAANVTGHGTGALNVDGCRVATSPEDAAAMERANTPGSGRMRRREDGYSGNWSGAGPMDTTAGRWPPNVLLGPDAAAELDRQSGASVSRIGQPRKSAAPGDGYGMTHTGAEYADQGGASRYFPVFRYEAKAPASERPRGEDGTAHPTVKPVDLMAWLVRLVTPPGGLVADPFAGSGTTAEACIVEGFRCVLIEKDPAYAALIRARLRKDIQPAMFRS